MKLLLLPGDAHEEGAVGRDRVLCSGGLNDLCGQSRANESMVNVTPAAFGGVACVAKGDAAKAYWGLLAGPNLALLDRHVDVANDQMVTWVGGENLTEQLLGEMDLPLPAVNGVHIYFAERVQPNGDGCMASLGHRRAVELNLMSHHREMSFPSQNYT
jgi:hypothetical protein